MNRSGYCFTIRAVLSLFSRIFSGGLVLGALTIVNFSMPRLSIKRICFSASAGAERIGRNFPIHYRDVTWKKEEFQDGFGKAYRYIYDGYAELYDRTVYCQGNYSTRDEFLGKKGGEWRPLAGRELD